MTFPKIVAPDASRSVSRWPAQIYLSLDGRRVIVLAHDGTLWDYDGAGRAWYPLPLLPDGPELV
jgi:hypothetical protein